MSSMQKNTLSTELGGIEDLRSNFLRKVAGEYKPKSAFQIILVTHLIRDRPALFEGLNVLGDLSAIIPIPYSIDESVLKWCQKRGLPVTLADDLEKVVSSAEEGSRLPIVVGDIGGKFSKADGPLLNTRRGRVLGIVEDTESGHKKYAKTRDYKFPVASVARSSLKDIEDRLIGSSLTYTVESTLRNRGRILAGMTVTILGYGKIGSSVADSLARKGLRTIVWDPDPIRQIRAIADGHATPNRHAALGAADLIIGASGLTSCTKADLPLLRDGAILASISSGTKELGDIPKLGRATTFIDGRLAEVPRESAPPVYILAGGTPANFLDNAVVGPVLSLVQGEILAAMSLIADQRLEPGLCSVSEDVRRRIAEIWIETFCDTKSGTYVSPPDDVSGRFV